MKKNMGSLDRIIQFLITVVLIAVYLNGAASRTWDQWIEAHTTSFIYLKETGLLLPRFLEDTRRSLNFNSTNTLILKANL